MATEGSHPNIEELAQARGCDEATDALLWDRIADGDQRAWEILVRRYSRLVYAVLTHYGLSLTDAADCFQDTWALLFQHRKRIRDGSRLSSWLFTTAKREALRSARRRSRQPFELIPTDSVASEPLPDEALEQIEKQVRLELALDRIDQRCRQVLKLFFFAPEEQSYEEIAKSLGLSANTLGPLRRRCLQRLKDILVADGFLDERKEP
jgi:RNA polymerase sigma factor (sigma-70 family)